MPEPNYIATHQTVVKITHTKNKIQFNSGGRGKVRRSRKACGDQRTDSRSIPIIHAHLTL